MRPVFVVLRGLGAIGIVAAVVAQLVASIEYWTANGVHDFSASIVNFFSFFTIQSNLLGAVVLAIGAVLLARRRRTDPRWFALLRASATTYLVTTGVVYNLLLRGIELPQGLTVPWSNELLHVAAPALMLVDWLFAPGRRRLDWGAIGVIVVYPIAWAGYTMIRGPFVYSDAAGRQGWYPYPFLDPATSPNGYLSVAFYVLLIAALIGVAGAGAVAVSRRRARSR